MKLLFVIKSLTLPGGGAERVLADLSGELAQRGHDVTVASFDPPGSSAFYAYDKRVTLAPLGIGRIDRESRPGEVLRRIIALRRLARQLHPDVAVGFMHSAYVPLATGLLGTGTPVIASEHTDVLHYRGRRLQSLTISATRAMMAAFTIPSERIRMRFPPVLANMMTVIPNPVKANPALNAGRSERNILLTLGRLRPEKGHSTVLSAFARVADAHPQWDLVIVGDGEERDRLEQQAGNLGLGDRAVFRGASEHVDSEYAAADLFVTGSTYESFGLATAEALAHGLPVVGFADCPGTNELIEDGVNGVLVEGEDRAAALAEGLARLIGSPEERARISEAAPRSVEQYSLGRVTGQWEDLLERVAKDGDAR
jgi:glycosyltransferase involved in cell wall biosynthesis